MIPRKGKPVVTSWMAARRLSGRAYPATILRRGRERGIGRGEAAGAMAASALARVSNVIGSIQAGGYESSARTLSAPEHEIGGPLRGRRVSPELRRLPA